MTEIINKEVLEIANESVKPTHICKENFSGESIINVFLIYLVIFFKNPIVSNKYYPNYFVKNDNT